MKKLLSLLVGVVFIISISKGQTTKTIPAIEKKSNNTGFFLSYAPFYQSKYKFKTFVFEANIESSGSSKPDKGEHSLAGYQFENFRVKFVRQKFNYHSKTTYIDNLGTHPSTTNITNDIFVFDFFYKNFFVGLGKGKSTVNHKSNAIAFTSPVKIIHYTDEMETDLNFLNTGISYNFKNILFELGYNYSESKFDYNLNIPHNINSRIILESTVKSYYLAIGYLF